MMDCLEATRKTERLKEGKLNFMERVKLRFHLLFCKYCHRFYKQWNVLENHFQKEPIVLMESQRKEMIKKKIDELK